MSFGLTDFEDIALSKEDVLHSRQTTNAVKAIRFAHKATAGQTGINLQALVQPTVSELSDYTPPSPEEIASARLIFNRNNLKLVTSRPGATLVNGANYRITSGTNITFINGYVAQEGEIFVGTIEPLQPFMPLVADARRYTDVIPVLAGQTTVNLGFTYRVGANDLKKVSSEYILGLGGQLLVRNTAVTSDDGTGHYYEVNAGNGYGSQIILNDPPVADTELHVVMGVMIAPGTPEIFGSIEQLYGALLALMGDAAQDIFGDNDLTRWLTANPSQLDRRAFGDQVLDHENRLDVVETDSNLYFTRVKRGAAQSINTGANTTVVFDTVEETLGTGMTLGSPFGGAFTANRKIRIRVRAQVEAAANASFNETTEIVQLDFFLNATNRRRWAGMGLQNVSVTKIIQETVTLNPGDYIEFQAFQNSGAANNLNAGNTYIEIQEVRIP